MSSNYIVNGIHGTTIVHDQINKNQMKSNKLPRYTSADYDKLDKTKNIIRILKVFSSSSDNPQVECELLNTDLSKEDYQPFEALSWCWGKSNETAYVNIRKGGGLLAKHVKPDLVSALRALRHYQKDRYLWTDGICIDQSNDYEKNHQVELMSEIYGKAERVCIWLGDPTESSRLALRFIKQEVLQLQDFDDLCDKKADTTKWNALLELMQRPWFSRRWVVQEIALARKALIYCGTDCISWRKFAIAVELFVEVETATHRLSEVMKKDPKYYHVPRWFEYVSALGASLLVDATGRLFRDSKPLGDDEPNSGTESESGTDDDSDDDNPRNKSDFIATRGQPLLSLEYLVSSLSIFDTSIEHDTIYALLAIARDTTPIARSGSQEWLDHTQDALERFTQKKRYVVDYKQPYVDVCKFFIQFCIERSLRTDPSRALDILFRPWAAEERKILDRRNAQLKDAKRKADQTRANRKYKRRRSDSALDDRGKDDQDPDLEKTGRKPKRRRTDHVNLDGGIEGKDDEYMPLPSWVPQLSGAPFAMYSQAGIPGQKMGRTNADPLVGPPSLLQRNYSAAETKKIDMKTFRFRKRTGDGLCHFSMYAKGFVLDRIEEVQNVSQGGSIPSEWSEFSGWLGTPQKDGDPPEEFWRTLVADRGKEGKNPPVYYARACKESFDKGGYISGSVSTTELINNERCSVIAQFCRRVQAVIWNRALVKTGRGKLGLVGQNAKRGDLVCILYGCSVPVILRRSAKKDDNVMQKEIEWEVKYLKATLVDHCRVYIKRAAFYKARRKAEDERYKRWEDRMWQDWKRDKDWRREWKKNNSQSGQLALVMCRRTLCDYLWLLILRMWREFKAYKKSKKELVKQMQNISTELGKSDLSAVSRDVPEQLKRDLSQRSKKIFSEHLRKIFPRASKAR